MPELKAWAIEQPRQAEESKAGFYLVLAYLFFEFGRPQELVPGIRLIPFGTGLSLLIILKVLKSGKLDFSRLQTKLWLPLFAVMAIHVPIAVNNYWALITFKDMVLMYGVYLGIITFVNSTEKMMTLMKLWMGLHVFLAVMGIAKGGRGIGAWMGDENRLLHGDGYGRPLWLFPIVFGQRYCAEDEVSWVSWNIHSCGDGKSFAGRFYGAGCCGGLLLVPLAQETECSHRGGCGGVVHAGACSRKILGRNCLFDQ